MSGAGKMRSRRRLADNCKWALSSTDAQGVTTARLGDYHVRHDYANRHVPTPTTTKTATTTTTTTTPRGNRAALCMSRCRPRSSYTSTHGGFLIFITVFHNQPLFPASINYVLLRAKTRTMTSQHLKQQLFLRRTPSLFFIALQSRY